MSSQAPPRWLEDCCRAYPQPTILVGGVTLQSADDQKQGFNTKNGAFTILSDPNARIGDQVTLVDVGGFAASNPATYQDSRGYPIQNPTATGLVLVSTYAMNIAGGSWTWVLMVDAISGTVYWASEAPAGSGGGGGGTASTFPRVFDGAGTNSPYAVLATDLITVFDNSSAGSAISATLPTSPSLGERHKFKWLARLNTSSPAPTVSAGANSIENVAAPGTFGTSAQSIPSFGEEVEFAWLLTGASSHAWVLVG